VDSALVAAQLLGLTELHKKRQKEYKDFYLCFTDITKAFNFVNRLHYMSILVQSLLSWQICENCTPVLTWWHASCCARWGSSANASSMFSVICVTKQGCVFSSSSIPLRIDVKFLPGKSDQCSVPICNSKSQRSRLPTSKTSDHTSGGSCIDCKLHCEAQTHHFFTITWTRVIQF